MITTDAPPARCRRLYGTSPFTIAPLLGESGELLGLPDPVDTAGQRHGVARRQAPEDGAALRQEGASPVGVTAHPNLSAFR